MPGIGVSHIFLTFQAGGALCLGRRGNDAFSIRGRFITPWRGGIGGRTSGVMMPDWKSLKKSDWRKGLVGALIRERALIDNGWLAARLQHGSAQRGEPHHPARPRAGMNRPHRQKGKQGPAKNVRLI